MSLIGNYTMCNIMTGKGFDTGFLGSYGMAWLGLVILFFIIAFARKWLGEEFGMPFSFAGGLVLGILSYLVLVTFTCSYKFALIAGLIGGFAGAYLLNSMFGGEGG